MADILVIDDDKDILRLLEFALKRAGHTVGTAFDGQQGLSHAEIREPDLIVCDVMMPKMTGYEFCRQARANPKLKNTPIIVFSARFQPIDKQTALEAGATDYLSKSTAPDVLVKRITDLLPQNKPATAEGMIGLFSLRGGVGVTSLSVNLSIALAKTYNVTTAIVDLAPLSGHAALMMGLRPTNSVSKLLSTVGDDLSSKAVENFFIQHQSGVQLLASPPAFAEQLFPDRPSLLNLLNNLKSGFSLTVLDVPHLLEPHFSPILQLLDKVLLVLSTDMPSVQSAAVALQGLVKLGLPDSKIMLVVNQVGQAHAVPLEIIQKAVKRPVSTIIPFDPSMTRAVNSGRPLLLSNPQSPAAKAIGQLAVSLFS